MKLLRAVILFASVQRVVWRTLLPDARVPLTVRGVVVSEREFASLLALFAVYAVRSCFPEAKIVIRPNDLLLCLVRDTAAARALETRFGTPATLS